jgi:hypothetical protein
VISEDLGDIMRKTLLVVFAALALAETLFCARTGLVDARNDLQETPPPQTTAVAAPPECVSIMRNIIRYIFKEKPNIAEDKPAQARWLTKGLREAIAKRQENCARELKANPTDKIDFPSNELFLGFWDRPTTFSILGSRSYDKRAVIDVLYSWGKGTNYPGDQEVVSFIFRLEDKSWLLDDIYFFNGRYATASSLQEELQGHY